MPKPTTPEQRLLTAVFTPDESVNTGAEFPEDERPTFRNVPDYLVPLRTNNARADALLRSIFDSLNRITD